MFKTLETFDTEFSADSVEWCPIEGFQDLFVCGTYQLFPDEEGTGTKSGQKRLGIIFLFKVESEQLKLLQKLNVPAVLDMKWAHKKCQGDILLGVVNSIGFLQVFKLKVDELEIELLTEARVCEDGLALSLDWSTGGVQNDATDVKIAVSDSKGRVSLFGVSLGKLECLSSQDAHEFEAWITAFDYWNTDVVYSGGDDCQFKRFDARKGLQVIGTNRSHEAGVTSLHSNPRKEFSLASGSYDETLRLWDTRNFRRPVSETKLGGGIWRLKWDPLEARYLLAACMYGGFRIVDCQNKDDPQVIAEYLEHQSIAYGCDWCALSVEEAENCSSQEYHQLVATCSFYDKMLKLSSVKYKNY
ncbi:GSCOCG00013282001-RA-CDS [Cotesia congregata]|uniref:methylated diphthine methylhydrolase n=1 Tax=Cotesia congregata TaxID=51543 RepID=A0A8J2HGC6_COTCN|nr:GSCOCG00013282001-RA-CDS [Cotesia congregata]CAG5094031.1 Similar to Dph7: Diphthine methyltransferase (Mus musculus) [Cotesia congregata]